ALNTDGTAFTNLVNFSATSVSFIPERDGPGPYASLTLSGDTLYGTTSDDGGLGHGTVFAVNTDGTGFTNLYNFTESTPDPGPYINIDGAYPVAGLTLSGKTLYGTAEVGGSSGAGTVFAVNTDGTGFTNLHTLMGGDGSNPLGNLILSGNTLYGTASSIFSSGYGTIFSLSFTP